MNNWDKLRQIRDWLTAVVTLLIIPGCWLVLDHQRLMVERYIDTNYVSKAYHQAYVTEHKDWGNREITRIEKQIDLTGAQYQGMNLKLDALILQVTALQTKLDSMKN